ncbi:response regulator [Paenibacillus sp. F411]|uniref:PAS/PAC sensor hybrid histidine kinase n=1 Tax=Paenibacillus algicola TaxID=2565926 RepID=A0A4P8XMS1_9BACL|nr:MULTISPECIES: response regulator [Paenibacillus]MBO2943658.1 response regulator [Paenibacillus sp. F411]QCT03733.1 PAS/PAC sensor hybrid histidine kinase [Paenibacillus algicola]
MTRSVLCVEDNRLNMQVMRHVIKRLHGVILREAVTAEQGIEIAQSERIDLIIMDIQLPGMDGFEALERLKEHEKTRDIPVIALSSFAEARDIERGLEAGFVEYVTKPIRAVQFMKLLEELLGVKEAGLS